MPDSHAGTEISERSEVETEVVAVEAGGERMAAGIEHPARDPESGEGLPLSREEALLLRGGEATTAFKEGAVRWWHNLRFLLFAFYLFFAAVVFWTWLVHAVFIVFRTLLRGVIKTLEWLGGGGPGSARRHYYPEASVDLWVRVEAVRWWHHLRFIAFSIYLVTAAIGFWLWGITSVIHGIRLLSSGLAILFAWIAGGGRVRTGKTLPEATRAVWTRRMVHYRDLARPLARTYVSIRNTAVKFWGWGWAHKFAAVVATVVLVGLPAAFIVPRPHYVQILDDNVIQHQSTPMGDVRYLIHAVDLFKPTKLNEYQNERAAHLGKLDEQGVKNALVPGRYYRLLVVGIRWWYMPTLFPNIISVKEVDIHGKPLDEPSHLIPHPSEVPFPAR